MEPVLKQNFYVVREIEMSFWKGQVVFIRGLDLMESEDDN